MYLSGRRDFFVLTKYKVLFVYIYLYRVCVCDRIDSSLDN